MNINNTYCINTKGRDFVVGDLHGCYNEFVKVCREVDFNTNFDRMFSVGDLIDRGPDSLKCLQLIDKPWFHPCLGNHEYMAVDALMHGPTPNTQSLGQWYVNGGRWHSDLNSADKAVISWLLDYFQYDAPYTITVQTKGGDIGISHAAPPSHWGDWENFPNQCKQDLIWGRTRAHSSPGHVASITGVDLTIHGHTAFHEVQKISNSLYIDTGCVFPDGKLTVMRIDNLLDKTS